MTKIHKTHTVTGGSPCCGATVIKVAGLRTCQRCETRLDALDAFDSPGVPGARPRVPIGTNQQWNSSGSRALPLPMSDEEPDYD